ncbi:DUF4153 domain-containing protein [Rhodopirellula sallentina]|uniref:Putative membrane protein n=1 Tax=Rhodopirellula sallentina SM41 TaxID=1263870 RepID=M5U3A0_9BACT|nr:DUF4153 domain-containing protein [Rhodopirellula sallentina]EMI52336.1 putative membrane protein [Rhodopirellula sallentina SM41]
MSNETDEPGSEPDNEAKVDKFNSGESDTNEGSTIKASANEASTDEPSGDSAIETTSSQHEAASDELNSPGQPAFTESAFAMLVEIAALAVWTLAADLFVFRARGYFAIAAFFLVGLGTLIILHLVRSKWSNRDKAPFSLATTGFATWASGAFLLIVIVRLFWSGSVVTSVAASFVFCSLVLSLSGWLPTLSRTLTLLALSPYFGMDRIPRLQKLRRGGTLDRHPGQWLSFAIPLVAVVVFGGIFVMANPDLVQQFGDWIGSFSGRLFDFLAQVSFWEFPFCVLAFFVGAGLLRPLARNTSRWITLLFSVGESHPTTDSPESTETQSQWYPPFRNMLLALIALFAAYLVFEFKTLWGREFPDGFYYAGYAHEGAAWLTVALALATFTLSLIFHHDMFRDPRVVSLRKLAWVWSAMNLILALAVYNRLCIYVGYNGMTRLRTIGFFGITLVSIGFVLVIIKILRRHSFPWLIQSQLTAFAIAVVLYSVFPVDYIVHRYNTNRVAAGYLKPSVMVAVKPIDDEGVFPLIDLIDHPDAIIREGVRAMLASRQLDIESYSRDTPWSWDRYQYCKTLLYRRLMEHQPKWSAYIDDADRRQIAMEDFQSYAMQWY